jgi:hypothetical protein
MAFLDAENSTDATKSDECNETSYHHHGMKLVLFTNFGGYPSDLIVGAIS